MREMVIHVEELAIKSWGVDAKEETKPKEPPKTPAIWTTKDRERIAVINMSDQHIQNAHKMMMVKICEFNMLIEECVDSGVGESYLDKMWSACQWGMIYHDELCRRQVNRLVSGPPIPPERIREPVWDKNEPLSEIPDGVLCDYARILRTASFSAINMLGFEPHGDAAQDAFDRAFDYANEMSLLAPRWLPVMRSEMARRGLEPEES